jgi:hypothetical protein
VPKRYWFQNSLDAITAILNNERDYQRARLEKQINIPTVSGSEGFVRRQARRLRRLLAQPWSIQRRTDSSSESVSIRVRNTKTCWIVCGPESSGSVLIAKTISHAIGASSQFSDYSGYGYNGEIGIDNLVLHRSIPFLRPKKNHHDLQAEIDELKQSYGVINYILTTREPLVSIISKTNRFGGDIDEGQRDLDDARDFFLSISREPTCFIWSYETMLLLGAGYFECLYRFFDVSSDFVPTVRDANKKYLLPCHDAALDPACLSGAPIVYFVNLFLKDGEPPVYVDHTIKALLNALNHAPTLHVKVAVMVDAADYKYFKKVFKGYGSVVHVCKLGKDSQGAKLPKLRDILRHEVVCELVGDASQDDAYCIYANADICVPTYFFSYIHQQIIHAQHCSYPANTARARMDSGEFLPPDAWVINRRDLFQESAEQPMAMAWHPGSDLFVFPSKFLPTMSFGDVTIGLPPIAPILWLNLLLHSRRTLHLSDSFVTWHHGNDQQWRSDEAKAQIDANMQAAALAFWSLIGGDKSKVDQIRYEDSINAKNLRSKAQAFVEIAESCSDLS